MKKIILFSCVLLLTSAINAQKKDQSIQGRSVDYASIEELEGGQSFMPGLYGKINKVDVDLEVPDCIFNPNMTSIRVILRIRENKGVTGTTLSQDTFTLSSPMNRQIVTIPITSEPILDTAKSYTLTLAEIIDEYCDIPLSINQYFQWYYASGNPYPRGEFINRPDRDYYFTTYVTEVENTVNRPYFANSQFEYAPFPNPFDNQIRLNLKQEPMVEISLYNVHGQRIIYQSNVEANEVQLNTEHLTSGVYTIVIQNEKLHRSTKMVKY